MKKATIFMMTALIGGALALTGCSGAKETLGLTRQAPDEFAVMERAPLEMPPDYSLRPPRPGAARPQEQNPTDEARTAIFGENTPQTQRTRTIDSGEDALLTKAGAHEASSDIRNVVDRETAALEPKDKPVAERFLGWTMGGGDQSDASVVDAPAEAERLRKNQQEGKPPTEGETPTVDE